jgi:radical SAM superfamily enzyme YgiQ (UPF0313 family)
MTNPVDAVIFVDGAYKFFARYSGAYKAATVLRQNGFTVQVVDHFLLAGLERTFAVLEKFVGPNTLFVGFSTTFMNPTYEHIAYDGSFKYKKVKRAGGGIQSISSAYEQIPIIDAEMDLIREKIKAINPSTQLVMGGAKAGYCEQPQMDAFILGYADRSIVEYARYLRGENPLFQFKVIGNQMVVDNDMDADGYDFVNSCILYDESDHIKPEDVLPIETARGCIFKCKFCSYRLIGKTKNDYIKTKETVYSEFMRNYEKFGTTRYIFTDDTYNESVQKLELFAEAIHRLPFKIEYTTYLRLDLIYTFRDMADLLKESGLKSGTFGIETLNHEAGKLIGKGMHPDKTREVLEWLRNEKGWKGNILTASGFIVGLPKETRETVEAWAEQILDPAYPLDTINISSLKIYHDSRVTQSEFGRNYRSYGYYYDPDKPGGWINEHWDEEQCDALAAKLHRRAYDSGRTRAEAFTALMMTSVGYTWDEIHNTTWSALIGSRDTFKIRLSQVDDYYRALLK